MRIIYEFPLGGRWMPMIFVIIVLILLHSVIFFSIGSIFLLGGAWVQPNFYEVGVCDFYKMIGTRASSLC